MSRVVRANPSSRIVLPSVFVSLSVIRCNNNLLHYIEWVERDKTKKERILVSDLLGSHHFGVVGADEFCSSMDLK